MNRWIFSIIFFPLCISQAVLETSRTLIITNVSNTEIPVWMNDVVVIETNRVFVSKWFFNNITIAELNPFTPDYNYSNMSPLNNITAGAGIISSFLNLGSVSHVYTGIYEAQKSGENIIQYSLNMVVHEVNLSSIGFSLTNDSNSCKAYLLTNDSIDPSNLELIRMANSSDLIFNSTSPSNTNTFEIINSHLNITNNNINTTIDIQYTFTFNNFSTIKSKNILLNVSLISQPTATIIGTPNNCAVSIRHNTNVQCVRNIAYCLNTNDTEVECTYSTNLNDLILQYPGNSTFANLSIVYDIIYAKYSFDINIAQCTPEEITTIQSDTSDNITTPTGMTDYSNSTYSWTSPTTTTRPPDNSGSLAGWQIALIVVGSVILFLLLLALIIVCFCLWKKKSKKVSDLDKSSMVRSSFEEHIVRKSIPPSGPTNRQHVQHNRQRVSTPRTPSTSSERTERRQHSQSSRYDHYIRPIIPPPISKPYDPSSRQETWHTRPQIRPLNHEQYPQSSAFQSIPPSFDPFYPSQVARDRHRPLEPNDDIVLQF